MSPSSFLPPRPLRRLHRLALATLVLSGSACYRYVPVPVAELRPDEGARVQLTAMAVERIRRGPPEDVRLLDGFAMNGTVARVGGDSLVLSLPVSSTTDIAVRPTTFFRPFALPVTDIRQAEMRLLDRTRTTWTVVAVGVLTAAAAVYAVQRGGLATGGKAPPIDPVDARLPFTIRLGRP